MTDREKYIEHCAKVDDISVFMQPWYLDIVCENNWEVAILEKEKKVVAALVYSTIKNKGLTYITSPRFTPAVGPYIKKNIKQKRINLSSQERKMILRLFQQLPKYDSLRVKLSPEIIDWRSLFWKGFKQTTYFSSRIDQSKYMKDVLSTSGNSVRALNKKAIERLFINTSSNSELLYRLVSLTFERKNKEFTLLKTQFYKLIHELKSRNNLIALVARNNENVDVGCIVCIEDLDAIYYLFGGFDPAHKSSGSQTALLISGIEISRKKNKHFDFEGSMVESIDNFFMAFDPDILPYSLIMHTPSYLLKIKQILKR